jgi:hypothetical protein
MKKFSLILVAAMALMLGSCYKDSITGDGILVTQSRGVTGFAGIDLRVSGEVYFQQDSVYKVEINAQQNILDVMETYVSENRLVIRFKNSVRVKSHDPVKVVVSAPSFNSLRISGSGNIIGTGSLAPSSMELDISGSGNITLADLKTGLIDADISGSGDVNVSSGSATEEKLKISGSGSMDLSTVAASRVNTKTSGSGDVRVSASQQLDVNISGSGSVYYKGNPVINTSISGSGKVIHF